MSHLYCSERSLISLLKSNCNPAIATSYFFVTPSFTVLFLLLCIINISTYYCGGLRNLRGRGRYCPNGP